MNRMLFRRFFNLASLLGFLLGANARSENSPEFMDMEPFTVTGTLQPTAISELPLSISSVDYDELSGFGAVSVSEGLDHVPGIDIQNHSGRIELPSIRGTRLSHGLILMNGRRMAPGFKSLVDLNQMLQGGVDRVEILRGPVSALYGSDAIGGVVNVITRRGSSADIAGDLHLQSGIGRYEQNCANLTVETLKNTHALLGSFSYRHVNPWESGDGPPSDVDKVETFGGFAAYDYHLSDTQTLRVEMNYSENERIGMRPTAGGALRTANDNRLGLSAEYEQTWNQQNSGIFARVYTDRYENDTKFDLPEKQAAKFNVDLESEIAVVDARVHHSWNDQFSTTAGFEYYETDIETSETTTPAVDTTTNKAVFLQAQWTPNKQIYSVFGARVDDHDGFGSHLSPRVSVSWSINKNWSVFTGIGDGFRAPNITELYLETFENGGKTTILPNENLEPESSVSYEIGLSFHRNRISFRGAYFHTEVEDLIEQTTLATQGQLTTKQWQNINKVEIDGFEVEAGARINSNFEIKGVFTWLNPIDKTTGYHIEGQHEWVTKIIFIGKLPDFGFESRLALEYESSVWGALDSTDYDESLIMNLKFLKTFNDSISGYIGVKNLLDKEHSTQLPAFYFAGITIRF